MKVKVDNTVYDSKDRPIMIILDDEEKEDIKNMSEECTRYCCHPGTPNWVNDDHYKLECWMRDI